MIVFLLLNLCSYGQVYHMEQVMATMSRMLSNSFSIYASIKLFSILCRADRVV